MVQEIREGSTGLVVTIDEDMIHCAAVTVCEAGYGSSFVIGKKLGIGYNRFRLLIEALREAGILGELDPEVWSGKFIPDCRVFAASGGLMQAAEMPAHCG